MSTTNKVREYHAARWNEPLVMEMGYPGRRGATYPKAEDAVRRTVGDASGLIPSGMLRRSAPALPEIAEPDVQRHYLHLSQEVLGMVGISLFGTCTMKYNPRVNEVVAARPEIAEAHPYQDEDSLQGVLKLIHDMDLFLRELSGMDQYIFQAGGGADAAYTHCCVMRGYHAARGQLAQRNEVITSIQAHPCNGATAASAGFKVITLMLEDNGYPSVEALKAAVSNRTAGLLINNPDDMGIYNPHIKEFIKIVHDAGGLCFYDHANFNGVMSKVRARELGFDACMFMLHKTFGAPKGGNGPSVGAYGCSAELAKFLPGPVVAFDGSRYRLENRPQSVGKVREYWGNVPQVIKAYSWARCMGAEGIAEASDLSVLANNYMEKKLLKVRGVTKAYPQMKKRRLEMTRFSFDKLKKATGVGAGDVQNRMVDFGIDAFWLAHEPVIIPEPFTPEAGERWSKEDIDTWLKVIEQIVDEAYTNPKHVKSAPHNQVIHQIHTALLDDPKGWAMTWRAFQRKRKYIEAAARAAAKAKPAKASAKAKAPAKAKAKKAPAKAKLAKPKMKAKAKAGRTARPKAAMPRKRAAARVSGRGRRKRG